jgi:hypothetical protein
LVGTWSNYSNKAYGKHRALLGIQREIESKRIRRRWDSRHRADLCGRRNEPRTRQIAAIMIKPEGLGASVIRYRNLALLSWPIPVKKLEERVYNPSGGLSICLMSTLNAESSSHNVLSI